MNLCKVFSEEHLHDIFISLDYYEILKHKEHFLECPECFNKLLNAYCHYFSHDSLVFKESDQNYLLGISQDQIFDNMIKENFNKKGECWGNEESFVPRVKTGSVFVAFCVEANNTKSANSILINGEIDYPRKGPLREIVKIFLKGFSNIKHIVVFNKRKIFDIEGKVEFYQRLMYQNYCCALSTEKTESGYMSYLQSNNNSARVILISNNKFDWRKENGI